MPKLNSAAREPKAHAGPPPAHHQGQRQRQGVLQGQRRYPLARLCWTGHPPDRENRHWNFFLAITQPYLPAFENAQKFSVTQYEFHKIRKLPKIMESFASSTSSEFLIYSPALYLSQIDAGEKDDQVEEANGCVLRPSWSSSRERAIHVPQ